MNKAIPATAQRRFQSYAEYRDSGIEWLGEIPRHWDVPPLRARYDVQLGKMLDAKRITGEHPAPYLRNVDVRWDAVIISDLPEMDIEPHEYQRYTLRVGDLLVCEGGEVGRTATWRGGLDLCGYQKAIHRLRPRLPSHDEPRFLYYVMVAAASRGVFLAGGNPNTIPHLTAEKLRVYRFAFPPRSEQIAIIRFLDRETAKIDALIAKKERLIELLQEKRAALITRAVTKGLDPNVPTKDSGVEWLGEIPAHWECLSLARVSFSRCDGPFGSGLKSEHYSDSGVRVVRLQNIGVAGFSDADRAYIEEEYACHLGDHSVIGGDLLIAGLGDEGHPVGRACVAPEGVEPAMVKADCFRFRLNTKLLLPQFAAYQLSMTAAAVAGSLATGSTRSRMNLTATAGRRIALPPLNEQLAIVEMLDQNAQHIGALVTKIREAIDCFKEYRTALISAAVTGKIDVRGIMAA